MPKRIKNWDKLNETHISYAGTFYEIKTHNILETDTESEYGFKLLDLKQLVLAGKLVITQSTVTDLRNNENKKYDEYTVKLRTYDSSKLVMQYVMFEEHIKDFDLFKFYLSEVCRQMLSKIEETNEWKIQNGYTA